MKKEITVNADGVRKMRKPLNAILGLVIGILTLPLLRIVWPLFLAWWLWNETDDG